MEFHGMWEEFYHHKTHLVQYLVFSLSNCAHKTLIETGLLPLPPTLHTCDGGGRARTRRDDVVKVN